MDQPRIFIGVSMILRLTTADENVSGRSVARVIRPGYPAKRDKEVSDTTRSLYARCPGLMTRATGRGGSLFSRETRIHKESLLLSHRCHGFTRIQFFTGCDLRVNPAAALNL